MRPLACSVTENDFELLIWLPHLPGVRIMGMHRPAWFMKYWASSLVF